VIPLLLATVLGCAQGAAAPAPREPGLSVRFYFVGEPMETLLPLVAGQTPNVSEVLSVLDLTSGKDDTAEGMQYTFLTVVDGFLVVRNPGRYALRLVSDDGSKLWLDGALQIDHDGLHATTAKDVEIELAAGEHPLLVRHFQSYGGWRLALQWKPPGAPDFVTIPTTALACPAGEVRVTAPGPKKDSRSSTSTRASISPPCARRASSRRSAASRGCPTAGCSSRPGTRRAACTSSTASRATIARRSP
jgi:hypothetical protein